MVHWRCKFFISQMKYLCKFSEWRPKGPSCLCNVCHRSKHSSWGCSRDFLWDLIKKRTDWIKEHIKISFKDVLFTDECHSTLERGWYCKEGPRPHRIRHQQGGGSEMFWDAIIGNELVGPFKVAQGVKITAKVYIDFLKEHLLKAYPYAKLLCVVQYSGGFLLPGWLSRRCLRWQQLSRRATLHEHT